MLAVDFLLETGGDVFSNSCSIDQRTTGGLATVPPSAVCGSLWLKPAVVHWSILCDLPPFQTFYNAVMSLYTITFVVTS